MRRVTVRWNTGAEQELAHLWLISRERPRIERAANEIDQLLVVGPASKGQPSALARLDEEAIRIIAERATVLPEDLRWVCCGPLEAFFVAREDDCMAIVLLVQLRSQS
jgi:hypothetical protein